MKNASPSASIDEILNRRHIVITCGTGGVGKTTLSAAMALRAALLGKKAVVITIDPAKRLATSLGIKTLGDHPMDLTPQLRAAWEKAKAQGQKVPQTFTGSLAAIVPDTRQTFESFVHELSPDPTVAERVMKNPIFQIFAKEFSGTNEYMALERLYSLSQQNNFDCIILDTPPSRNTLAFLEAPKLLAQFFEAGLVRWLVLPANQIIAGGMKKALSILEKLTGAGFITHLFDFAAALFEVRVAFTANLKRITALLESDQVGFLMVTVPAPDTVPEALHFISNIHDHGFHFDGVAVNRTLSYLGPPQPSDSSASTEPALEVIRAIQEREHRVIEALAQRPIPLCAKLPELARDVHSVEDLFHVAMALDSKFDE
ncbi:ArsA-related P-loop ATPase [Bdellovibrionota bacterium FG-1]